MEDPHNEVKEWLAAIEPVLKKINEHKGTAWASLLQKDDSEEMHGFAQWAHDFLEHQLTKPAASVTGSREGEEAGSQAARDLVRYVDGLLAWQTDTLTPAQKEWFGCAPGAVQGISKALAALSEISPSLSSAIRALAAPVVESRPGDENPLTIVAEVLADWFDEVGPENDYTEAHAATFFGLLGTAGYSILPNAFASSPAPVAPKGAAAPAKWLDPNRGPRCEWKDGVQILHPVLVAREGAEEAELACWCDMNDEWLQFENGKLTRLDDVDGWQPLPVLPTASHPTGN